MANIDRAKDFINNIRLYMSMILAMILAIGSGITKMYNANNYDYLFYAGNIIVLVLIFLFMYLAKLLHKKTDELKDIK